jgi:integrase
LCKLDTTEPYIATIRQFMCWLIDKKGYHLKNPFNDVTRKVQATNNEIIEQDEFKKLLEVVRPENGLKEYPNGKRKNMYRDWIKNAFKIALETGLRREEFMTLKFSNIVEGDNVLKYIRVKNLKLIEPRILLMKKVNNISWFQ